MRFHWLALAIGFAVGGSAAYFMAKGSGANLGISQGGPLGGGFAAPFQARMSGGLRK